MNFIERKVTSKRAISALAKNGVELNDSEAIIILDFLYFIAKNSNQREEVNISHNPKEMSNTSKSRLAES